MFYKNIFRVLNFNIFYASMSISYFFQNAQMFDKFEYFTKIADIMKYLEHNPFKKKL